VKSVFKGMTFLGLVAILLVTSVLTACGGGGGGGEAAKVTVGWLADQTGASASAFKEVRWGMEDYFAEMEPIEGVDLEMIVYDTRLEYGRYTLGYEWLVGQGMDFMMYMSPDTPNVTQPSQVRDKIATYGFTAYSTMMDADWVYSYMYTNELEGRAIMNYVINTWWPSKGISRPVKVGTVGNINRSTTDEFRKGFDKVLADNPGKAVYSTVGGDVSQSAWASEYAAVKDCDIIVMTTTGTSTGTFLKEAVNKGYTGQYLATTTSVLGIWTLLTALVPKASFNGMLIPHFYPLWTDDTSYTQQAEAALAKYRATDAAKLREGTTWISGWLTAQIVAEAVRKAAADAGAKNVDGEAIKDALNTMKIENEGMPAITLANSGTHHVFQPYHRFITYNAAADEWSAITDWMIAPGFAT